MPGLYNITSNANVSVGDTIGLYQQSGGNVYILNNAQQLLNTLSQNGNVNFALDPAYANTRVLAFTADIGTTAGTYGSDLLIPVVTVSGDGRITSITEVNISATLGSYGNANVAAYLPTYTGTLDNSSTIIALVANAGAQAANINTLFANAAVQSVDISALIANAGVQATSINSLTANAATQALQINGLSANITAANLHIQTIDANLGAFEAYANATFGTSNYGNANVAVYLASNTDPTISTLNANAAVQQIQIDSLNANVSAANLRIQTIDANLGAFETYVNLNIGSSSYSNTNVAAYLSSNTDPTISNLNANAAVQAVQIDTLNANLGAYQTYANANVSSLQNQITGANTNIQTISANLGSYQTFANANVSSLQNQITGANTNISTNATNIQTISANLGAFETYANATFITSAGAYGNANVAAYLPVYGGNIAATVTTGYQPNINFIGNSYYKSAIPGPGSTGTQIQGDIQLIQVGGALLNAQANLLLTNNTVRVNGYNSSFQVYAGNASVTYDAGFGTGGYLTVDSQITTGNIASTNGYFWANGTPYSTGGGTYGNVEVAAFLPTYTGTLPVVGAITTTAAVTAGNVISTSGYFWANGVAYSTGGGVGSNFTSNLTVNSNYIIDAQLQATREKSANIGVIQGTVTIDGNTGPIQTATVTANITINTNNLTNFNTGQSVTLVLTQNTNANLRLLTSNLKYAGGSKILSSANAAIDTISITYDGTNYLASLVKGYA